MLPRTQFVVVHSSSSRSHSMLLDVLSRVAVDNSDRVTVHCVFSDEAAADDGSCIAVPGVATHCGTRITEALLRECLPAV